MTRRETVKRAIAFKHPERIPLYFFNRDQLAGDILLYGLNLQDGDTNEWGYKWKTLDDGTMGQPHAPVLPAWSALDTYRFPELAPGRRLGGVAQFYAAAANHYLLGGIGISGFNLYTFLRGFENAMTDFVADRERAAYLLDRIMGFETDLITLAAEAGFDGVHFSDDWGGQDRLLIEPALWRALFKPRYRAQFDHAHALGLDVWFHSCGCISSIVNDWHEIGVDVMNISQPNVNDLEAIGCALRGKQCFMVPISYQTVSISGTPDDIADEAKRMHAALGAADGGFIGYIEEYSCMGMSEQNYQACIAAFQALS